MEMDDATRLNLSKMIKEYQSEETTDKIRNLKHSLRIRDSVTTMIELKRRFARMEKSNNETFKTMCKRQCSFLYDNYTNLFNKLFKDELDLNILHQFLDILHRIEEGEIDQHEGSYLVGLALKKLYIDSAVKREEKMTPKATKPKFTKARNVSWNEYKKMSEP